MGDEMEEILARSAERRRRMVVHRAASFDEAEAWDLEYWQARSPEERLEAFLALRRDVELVLEARGSDSGVGGTGDRRP